MSFQTHLHDKPRKLRDFLNETSNDLNKHSSSSPSTTIQSLLLKFVKNITFTGKIKKSPTFLPRTLSRRLSSRNKHIENHGVNVTVKVKDILRWTSFRDLADEKPHPLETGTPPPHHQYYCTTTTTTTSNTTTCSSNSSSWCDSDFTSECLPSWSGSYCEDYGKNEVEMGKKKEVVCVGDDFLETTIKEGSFVEAIRMNDTTGHEKEEQRGATCRLHHNYQQEYDNEEESISSSSSFEDQIEATASLERHICSNVEDQLLLDLFWELELNSPTNEITVGHKDKLWISTVEDGLSGEAKGLKWGLDNNKEACIAEMDASRNWNKFADIEKKELAVEIETRVLNAMVDELLVDLFLQ